MTANGGGLTGWNATQLILFVKEECRHEALDAACIALAGWCGSYFANWPYTLFCMMPTNNKSESEKIDAGTASRKA